MDAVVVGAGPNGLTAAARLAVAGWRVVVFEAAPTIGGGSRTMPLTTDSVYDVCAAAHPFGASSPAFEALDLAAHGLRWMHPPTILAHPFDGGDAAVLHRDADATTAQLGRDQARWQRTIGGYTCRWPELRHAVLGPPMRHPLRLASFAPLAALPAATLARLFTTRHARALITGNAAHSGLPSTAPFTGGIALALLAAGQSSGMPFARGGSQAIVDALASVVTSNGGEIVTDHRVTSLAGLPPARATLLDVTPTQLAALAGRPRPTPRLGPGTSKLDLLLSGPMPWTSPACHTAGTIHLDGTDRTPFVIVTQPCLADPTRAPAGQHVIWAYRRVPTARTGGAEGIEVQLDRFAPGWRDLVVHHRVTTAADFAAYNLGYPGGDIGGGAFSAARLLGRGRRDPYRTRVPGTWLCGQSTPPGPGVHGMCGWHAAGRVLGR